MKTIKKKIFINASPDKIFGMMDDLGVTGMHMTKSSTMMMGSKLDLEYLTERQVLVPGTDGLEK